LIKIVFLAFPELNTAKPGNSHQLF
jgi:hypothetical protein